MDGPGAEGRFHAQLKRKKGTYEYKFVLDDQTREPDLENAWRDRLLSEQPLVPWRPVNGGTDLPNATEGDNTNRRIRCCALGILAQSPVEPPGVGWKTTHQRSTGSGRSPLATSRTLRSPYTSR